MNTLWVLYVYKTFYTVQRIIVNLFAFLHIWFFEPGVFLLLIVHKAP